MLRAAGGRELRLMFPMIAAIEEFDKAKSLVEVELTHLRRHGHALPERVQIGTMLEVPSLLFQLDELLERVDFLSVGSNDLMQFLYAADRGNTHVAHRFDPLSAPVLRALKDIADKAKKHAKPVAVCGELASQPIGALALAITRLSLAVTDAVGGRSGQSHAARTRLQKGRGRHPALPGAAGRQRVDPSQARGLCGGRGTAALIALPQHRLDALLHRHALVESELATNLGRDDYVKLSREFSDLGPVIEAIKAYRAVSGEIDELNALIADPATDAEMRKLVESEKPGCRRARTNSNVRSVSLLSPRMRWTITTPSSKSAPAPAATRLRCSPATCSACMSATPPSRAGRPKCCR